MLRRVHSIRICRIQGALHPSQCLVRGKRLTSRRLSLLPVPYLTLRQQNWFFDTSYVHAWSSLLVSFLSDLRNRRWKCEEWQFSNRGLLTSEQQALSIHHGSWR